MKVLIIEDERFAYQSLYEAMRELYPEAIIEGPITTVKNMREALASAHDYDIIFSDIRLDDGLSFEALADVRLTTPIIFTTAYDEYALAAFRTGGIAYLLKPIDTDELTEAMQRAMKLRMTETGLQTMLQLLGVPIAKPSYRSHFLVPAYDGQRVLSVDYINHITINKNRVTAFLMDGNCVTMEEKSLDVLEQRLDPAQFFRANRQYIVALNAIDRINNFFNQAKTLHLKGFPKVVVKVSKEKYGTLKNWIS